MAANNIVWKNQKQPHQTFADLARPYHLTGARHAEARTTGDGHSKDSPGGFKKEKGDDQAEGTCKNHREGEERRGA
ncbi:hypothetical protein GMST_32890 [Geomonas silvestris]|uniref:Uncharacterized protein n=1 Tax=Geomonas silvestris TaxID=2740184 RepID=A0A6V8MM15_9BACT|nr:hypothetical protein GMST_32890 [Geomonas silvestris]